MVGKAQVVRGRAVWEVARQVLPDASPWMLVAPAVAQVVPGDFPEVRPAVVVVALHLEDSLWVPLDAELAHSVAAGVEEQTLRCFDHSIRRRQPDPGLYPHNMDSA